MTETGRDHRAPNRNAIAKARREGRVAGVDPNRFAGDCPYKFDALELRLAWMDGLGEGRIALANENAHE